MLSIFSRAHFDFIPMKLPVCDYVYPYTICCFVYILLKRMINVSFHDKYTIHSSFNIIYTYNWYTFLNQLKIDEKSKQKHALFFKILTLSNEIKSERILLLFFGGVILLYFCVCVSLCVVKLKINIKIIKKIVKIIVCLHVSIKLCIYSAQASVSISRMLKTK